MHETKTIVKRGITAISLFLLSGAMFRCNDSSTAPDNLNDLHLRFVRGSIGANLMPSVPPDPIGCEILFIAENTGAAGRRLKDLTIPKADVFLATGSEKLGSVTFSTLWDGEIGPGERDTVRIQKNMSPTPLFPPQCGKYVYLTITMQNAAGASIVLTTDSLYFGCVY